MLNKIALPAFLLIVGSTASAQTTTTFGVKAGLNFASATNTTSAITSFLAGAFANVGLSKSLWLQPGLYYSGKGYKNYENVTYEVGRFLRDEKCTLSYLQLPLNLVYHRGIKQGSFFVGAGPFAAVALNGRLKGYIEQPISNDASITMIRTDYNLKIEIGKDHSGRMDDYNASGIKRMDFGATALAGFAFNNGLLFNMNYDLGLTNIRSGNYGTIKTRTIGFSLGFNF